MDKNKQLILLKNSLLILVLIIACAILSRCALQGETLSEYEQNRQPVSSIENTPEEVQETLAESISKQETLTESTSKQETLTENIQEEDVSIINTPMEEPMEDRITYQKGFYYESLSPSIIDRIRGCSYPADDKDCQISLDDLCYVSVLHYNFDDNVKSGELICNRAIAEDLVEIFYELYQAEYPIEQIRLVDEYSADDELSMADNNTSCFNYRVVAGTTKLSNHSYGLAIDINPFFNPYVTFPNGEPHASPAGSEYYVDRSKEFAYKITTDDLVYKLFTEHGFTWGGNWNSSKDYQHFEKKLH